MEWKKKRKKMKPVLNEIKAFHKKEVIIIVEKLVKLIEKEIQFHILKNNYI